MLWYQLSLIMMMYQKKWAQTYPIPPSETLRRQTPRLCVVNDTKYYVWSKLIVHKYCTKDGTVRPWSACLLTIRNWENRDVRTYVRAYENTHLLTYLHFFFKYYIKYYIVYVFLARYYFETFSFSHYLAPIFTVSGISKKDEEKV